MNGQSTQTGSGDGGIAALCAALRDPNPEVVEAAAAALGQCESPRALGPLLEVLRERIPSGSNWQMRSRHVCRHPVQYAVSLVALSGAIGAAAWMQTTPPLAAALLGGILLALLVWLAVISPGRRRHGKPTRDEEIALVQTLVSLTQRYPIAEVSTLLPGLRFMADDPWLDEELAQVVRQAVAAFTVHVEQFASLPRPTETRAAEASTLPLPTEEPGS